MKCVGRPARLRAGSQKIISRIRCGVSEPDPTRPLSDCLYSLKGAVPLVGTRSRGSGLQRAIVGPRAECDTMQGKLHRMYVDELDGRILWKAIRRLGRATARQAAGIAFHRSADRFYLEDRVRVLGIAKNTQEAFAAKAVEARRQIIESVLSNPSWKAVELKRGVPPTV